MEPRRLKRRQKLQESPLAQFEVPGPTVGKWWLRKGGRQMYVKVKIKARAFHVNGRCRVEEWGSGPVHGDQLHARWAERGEVSDRLVWRRQRGKQGLGVLRPPLHWIVGKFQLAINQRFLGSDSRWFVEITWSYWMKEDMMIKIVWWKKTISKCLFQINRINES